MKGEARAAKGVGRMVDDGEEDEFHCSISGLLVRKEELVMWGSCTWGPEFCDCRNILYKVVMGCLGVTHWKGVKVDFGIVELVEKKGCQNFQEEIGGEIQLN